MHDEPVELDLKAVQDTILMHEDVSAALASLPDFGFMSKKNLEDIERAREIVDDLRLMLQYYINTGNHYQETFNQLLKLLEDAGVFQCVDDLIHVRRNSRHTKDVKVSEPRIPVS